MNNNYIDEITKRLRVKYFDNKIILLTYGGSYAYGTNNENSDIDIRGIMLPSKNEIMSMNCKDKPYEDNKTDTVIYPFKQIINLLINVNPNVLEVFGTKPEHLFICAKEGKMLRDNVYTFLSKRAINSFGGYATAQLRRLQNALARDNYPQKEKERHMLNSILNQMQSFKERYTGYTGNEVTLYLDKSNKDDFEEEIFMDLNLTNFSFRDFKSVYSEMSNVLKDYDSLNHRNNKKDELHLNKHAMHLVRLLIMGTEILEGKGINTYRGYDRELLLKIRNGEFIQKKNGKDDYSLIFEMVDEYEKKFKYAADNTNLPDKPNYKKINELVIEINRGVINNE